MGTESQLMPSWVGSFDSVCGVRARRRSPASRRRPFPAPKSLNRGPALLCTQHPAHHHCSQPASPSPAQQPRAAAASAPCLHPASLQHLHHPAHTLNSLDSTCSLYLPPLSSLSPLTRTSQPPSTPRPSTPASLSPQAEQAATAAAAPQRTMSSATLQNRAHQCVLPPAPPSVSHSETLADQCFS